MKPTHIEHIGIAVKSLEEAIPYYEKVLGLECYAVEEVADQKVKTAFFKVGQTKIELLEPTCEESTIASFLEKKGAKLYPKHPFQSEYHLTPDHVEVQTAKVAGGADASY